MQIQYDYVISLRYFVEMETELCLVPKHNHAVNDGGRRDELRHLDFGT
jgi:hypothetical protein